MPIIAFEDELAGKKYAVRKFTVDLLGEIRELFDRIGAEGKVPLGGEAVMVASEEYADAHGWELTAIWPRQELQRLHKLLDDRQHPGPLRPGG